MLNFEGVLYCCVFFFQVENQDPLLLDSTLASHMTCLCALLSSPHTREKSRRKWMQQVYMDI